MKSDYLVVLVTVPSLEMGQIIARQLVESKHAACVNLITPIHSIYSWQGTIQEDTETTLVIKTRAVLFEDLANAVKGLHSYDVPEIIALPIKTGSSKYLDWIAAETAQPEERLE